MSKPRIPRKQRDATGSHQRPTPAISAQGRVAVVRRGKPLASTLPSRISNKAKDADITWCRVIRIARLASIELSNSSSAQGPSGICS